MAVNEKGVSAANRTPRTNRLFNKPYKPAFANNKRKAKKRQIFIRFNADNARKFLPVPGSVRNVFALAGSFAARQIGGNDAA